jgi:hypothetical protein
MSDAMDLIAYPAALSHCSFSTMHAGPSWWDRYSCSQLDIGEVSGLGSDVMFKKQLLASVAAVAVLIGTAEMASAADLILKARNTSANKDQLWNGWYVGGEVGWAESRFRGVHQGRSEQ